MALFGGLMVTGHVPRVSDHRPSAASAAVAVRWKATQISDDWHWCSEDETGDARSADAIARDADRAAFHARHEARAKAKAEPIDVESDHPGLADGVSYSLGDPEAARVMKQMRLDADDARRAHGADRRKSP